MIKTSFLYYFNMNRLHSTLNVTLITQLLKEKTLLLFNMAMFIQPEIIKMYFHTHAHVHVHTHK